MTSGASTELAARRVLTPGGFTGPAVVVVEDGLVARVAPTTGPVPARTLVPGFVDLQRNGSGSVDVAEADGAAWDLLDADAAAEGVTTWFPTLVSAPLDTYPAALSRIGAAAVRPGVRPAVAGVHLEGPFLGARPGVHPPEAVVPLDPGWLAALGPLVRIVALGPEQPGAAEAVAALAARGVLVSLAHSDATAEQVVAAAEAGARLAGHLFNAMAPIRARAPGPAGAALADDRLAVSLVADGAHVHPLLVRLAFRAKPAGGVVLVTDRIATGGALAERLGLHVAGGAVRTPDGTLAGACAGMDAAVRTAVAAGVPGEQALTAASAAPARLAGLADRGALAPGLRADVVALDDAGGVVGTWIGGTAVHG